MKKRVKRKLFGCYATWLKDGIYAVTSLSACPNIYSRESIFFWKGIQQSIQQFDYCNKTSKGANQR